LRSRQKQQQESAMNNRRDFENQPAPPTMASPTVPTPPVQQTAWSEQDPYGGSYTPYDQPQQGMYSEQQPQPQPQYDDQPAQQYYAQQAAPQNYAQQSAPQYYAQQPPVSAPEAPHCRGTGSRVYCSAAPRWPC
jgi:hypothetical protein